MSGHQTDAKHLLCQICISASFVLVPQPSDPANLTSTCTCNISTLMAAALSPAECLARHNPQGQNSSAGCSDQLHKALAAGCTPIRRCYLGT
eukprot:3441855-Rhodomonas_salina.1